MNQPKNLHIFNFEEKFSIPFFTFLKENEFDLSEHELFHYGVDKGSYDNFNMKYVFARYFSVIKHLKLLRSLFKAKKIIIHSLASPWVLFFLFLFPSITKKVYWVIWGKDLYFYQLLKKKHFYHYIYEYFRKKVLKDIQHIITYVRGDYELAKKWYKTEAQLHECLMYPSNLFKNDIEINEKKNSTTITIQVGNSADPSNNHQMILEHLKPYCHEEIQIIIPLSYGNKNHAKLVAAKAQSIFNDKCLVLQSFMPFDEYIKLLNEIDIAIFAHKRQQGMGNIISLLGMGKKVYLDDETTSYQLFNSLGLKLFNLAEINTQPISNESKILNKSIIKSYFTAEKLKIQWLQIFSHN